MPKSGTVRDLLQGLQQKAKFDDETTQNVRIYEVRANKVNKALLPDDPVAILSDFAGLYAEKIPEEEQNADRRDLVDCFHFEREPSKPHGIPFKFLIKRVSDPAVCQWTGLVLTRHRTRHSKTPDHACLSESVSKANNSTRSNLPLSSRPSIPSRPI